MMSQVRSKAAWAAEPKPIEKIPTSELEEELARRKHIHTITINGKDVDLNLDEMRFFRDAIDKILIANKVRTERISENPVNFKG